MEEAIAASDLSTIKDLLEDGYDPNTVNAEGTPLLFLTEKSEIIDLLLSYGADSKKPDENGFLLSEYTEDETILALLVKERNIISQPKKFSRYRGTIRAKNTRTKTRRRGHQMQTT